jgi:hypothetical protein
LIEAAAPGASPSALVKTLAAEATRDSVALKVGLATVAIVLGLGGLAFGIDGASDQPEIGPRRLPARHEVVVASAAQVDETKWATLRGRITFPEGKTIPPARVVPPGMIKDAEFFGVQTYRDVQIDTEMRGIANAVVWLRPDTENEKEAFPGGKIHPALVKAKPVERSIRTTHEGFSPRVTAARAGDRLSFSNPTPVIFTIRYELVAGMSGDDGENRRFNVLLPPGRTHATAPLPGPRVRDTFTDSIHSWVRGYVWSFDHPYFAVTDAKGNFEIKNAPPGTWRLVVWQEKVGYRNGAKGRLGERIVIAPGGELKPIALESANWDE